MSPLDESNGSFVGQDVNKPNLGITFSHSLNQRNSSSFTPLFHLLDDFDRAPHTRGREGSSGSVFWHPKFDISESRDGYELHGELPGMKKDDIHIEFPEPQTLVVRGKSIRTQTVTSPDQTIKDNHFTLTVQVNAIYCDLF